MSQNRHQDGKKPSPEMENIRQWQQFLGVVYRILIILGLISFLVILILVVFTDIISFWFFILPFIMIVFGIILARLEYVIHKNKKV